MSNRKDSPAGRSGRGIGIPALGAVGGGDGAQQKIGHPKRPYLQGDAGSPNQSADSNFSSRLSRVNKGRSDDPEFAYHQMFPDQDDDFEIDDDLVGLRTRKLPIYFAGMKRIPESMRREPFGRPTLSATLLTEGEQIDESFIEDLAKGISAASDYLGSFVGAARPVSKVASKVVPGFTPFIAGAIPGFDVIYGSASSIYNYKQIKKNLERMDLLFAAAGLDYEFDDMLDRSDQEFKDAVDQILADEGSEEILKELRTMLGNYKDIAVSLILMSDTLTGASFAGPVGIASTAATSAAAVATTFATDYEGMIKKLVSFFSALEGAARSLVEKGLRAMDPGMSYEKFVQILKRTGELYSALKAKKDAGETGENLYSEARKKRKKPAAKNEFSSVGGGSITGFVAPMSDFPTAARRKEFEKVAAKTFGGAKRVDESARFIVNGRRSLIKALLD